MYNKRDERQGVNDPYFDVILSHAEHGGEWKLIKTDENEFEKGTGK